ALPLWPLGTNLSFHVHVSTLSSGSDVFDYRRRGIAEKLPSFVWDDIVYGDWKFENEKDVVLDIPSSVHQNASALWAHIFITANGSTPDPYSVHYNPANVHHVEKRLTKYMPRRKIRKEKSLLSSDESDVQETEEVVDVTHSYPEIPKDGLLLQYWHPNLTLGLVSDATAVPYTQLTVPLFKHVHLEPSLRDATGQIGYHYPILFPNEFWHLQDHYAPITTDNSSVPLRIVLYPISYFKFQLFASMTHGMEQTAETQGTAGMAELDELKRMLSETKPWLLITTAVVSTLHMVFEFLAFTSDVSHWRKKEEMVGVSVRTIITNVFVQLVILLYLVDNNAQTSWMILFGQGTGILIEAWKVTKAVDIKLVPSQNGATLPYRLQITDKHVLSEDEKKTQEYDKLAFRYVSYFAYPMLAIYTVYSLVYETHRGWYSFVIGTLTSFVYMFGFAQLIPQLIINYKLKSVAHMPMKAMIFKTLSTVVDDFFAFCIKMPFLHRLACFRDDLVFLVFLYQRWIYRVDPNRVNEFGQVLGEEEKKKIAGEGAGESKKDK
ncbi:hypothetical protein BOTBODRAFT_105998, partial [Botryobasidium botryosum FD-172 SS1]